MVLLSSVVSRCQVRVVCVSGVCRSGCVSGKKIKKEGKGIFLSGWKGASSFASFGLRGGFLRDLQMCLALCDCSLSLRIQTVLSQ